MGRILALDIGTRRIGVAVSDSRQMVASALKMLERQDFQQALHRLKKYIEEYDPELMVFGLPLDSRDGSFTPKCHEVLADARLLYERFGIPMMGVDERYSTRNNTNFLIEVADLSRAKRKQAIDSLAAREILQNYLDQREGVELAAFSDISDCSDH